MSVDETSIIPIGIGDSTHYLGYTVRLRGMVIGVALAAGTKGWWMPYTANGYLPLNPVQTLKAAIIKVVKEWER